MTRPTSEQGQTRKRTCLFVSLLVVGSVLAMLRWYDSHPSRQTVARTVSGCGPNALAVVLRHRGYSVDVDELAALAGTDERGWTSLYGLAQAAKAKGIDAVGYHLEIEELSEIPLPAVVHVRGNHFVALTEYRPPNVTVVDGGRVSKFTVSEFAQIWDGTALVLDHGLIGLNNP